MYYPLSENLKGGESLNFKLTKKVKLQMIDMNRKGYSRAYISKLLGVNESTYRNFISKYKEHGELVFEENKQRRYPNKFKKEILKLVNSGHSKKSVAIKYNLPGDSSVIRQWLANEKQIMYNEFIETETENVNMNKKEYTISNVTDKEQEHLIQIKKLLDKIETLEIENEYLKKLDVLVETRTKQQQKKK